MPIRELYGKQKENYHRSVIERYPAATDCPHIFDSCIDDSIGKGWLNLVNQLIDDILRIDPNIKIVQIKEKFGSLRFYYDYGDSTEKTYKLIDDLVSKAEKDSKTICEACGSAKDIDPEGWNVNGYWVKTLCSSCIEKVERKENIW
jgi:hypothetical protein